MDILLTKSLSYLFFGSIATFYENNIPYRTLLPIVLFNLCIVLPVFSLFPFHLFIKEATGSLWFEGLKFIGAMFAYDFFFYFYHRFMHKYFWDIHKVHHKFKKPYGIGSAYSHPLDFYFGDLWVMMLSVLLFRPSCWLVYVWIVYCVADDILDSHLQTREDEFHQKHHKFGNCNFGHIGLMDLLVFV
jgi:sterol desaturase/sphingolipid hydroxylase (fatty acid hydroxylase superfamily)